MQILDLAVVIGPVAGYSIEVVGDEVIEYAGARLRCTPSKAARDGKFFTEVYWTFTNPNHRNPNHGKHETIFSWNDDTGGGIKDDHTWKWSNPTDTFDIVINRATRADNGTYTCMVIFTNSEIRIEETNLIVKVPPSKPKLISPQDKKLVLGEPGKLQCYSSNGNPRPKFIYERCKTQYGKCIRLPSTASTDRRVFGDSTFHLDNDSSTGDQIVQFNPVRPVDKGYYRCVAQNSAGSTESEIFEIKIAFISVRAIVGIVLGVVLGIGLIVVGVFFLMKKDPKPSQGPDQGPDPGPKPGPKRYPSSDTVEVPKNSRYQQNDESKNSTTESDKNEIRSLLQNNQNEAPVEELEEKRLTGRKKNQGDYNLGV